MTNTAELELLPAVICDDIRVEASGKQILTGVYPSNIIVSQFPAMLVLAAWLPQRATKIGKLSMEIRVFAPSSDAPIAQVKGEGEVVALGRGGLAIPPVPISVTQAGDIRFEVRVNEGEWQAVAAVPVMLGAIPEIPVRMQPPTG